MNIIHIMADGTTRKSVDGVVVTNDQFYQVANGILEKQKVVHSEKPKETYS